MSVWEEYEAEEGVGDEMECVGIDMDMDVDGVSLSFLIVS